MRTVVFVYGLLAYLAFGVTFTYAIGFVSRVGVPKHIDSGAVGPLATAILINALLLGLFAVQHTIMARPGFKRWWTRFVPVAAERSTFVLAASICLALTLWQWRAMPEAVWHFENTAARVVLTVIGWFGWVLVLYSTFVIDHFDLFGLRQVWFHFRGKEYHHPPFIERTVYRFIRHPLMLGFILAFWATPDMSAGRLLFAALGTAYILVGIQFEERDLLNILGPDYREYRSRTPMLVPLPRGAKAERAA